MGHEERQSCLAPIKSTTVPRSYSMANLGLENQFLVVTFVIRFMTYAKHYDLKMLIKLAQNLKSSVKKRLYVKLQTLQIVRCLTCK